jgi:hypothetical protein
MHARLHRNLLAALLAFVTLNAIGGGFYALAGAKNVPVEWLERSVFSSYLVPGLILLIGVGGTTALAAIAVLTGHRRGFDLAKLAGWVLVTWLIEEAVIIGLVSWLQPAMFAVAAAILVFAYRPDHLRRWRTT